MRGFSERQLVRFVTESNAIEGIRRSPLPAELEAHREFLNCGHPRVEEFERFVKVVAPGMRLRAHAGMDVRVGNHVAPRGGVRIPLELDEIIQEALAGAPPFEVHVAYETLHPFEDGNGRSGRALWAWQMVRQHEWALELGFLHAFYYQTLEASH